MPRFLPLLVAVFLLLDGCGYIGNPLPPLANVPGPVTGLAAVQRDVHIVVHFKLPIVTTENVTIKTPLKLDLRIGAAAGGPFHAAEFVSQSTLVPPGEVKDGIATYAISSTPWTGKSVVIGARVAGANGKESNWAVLEALPVIAPPQKPGKLALLSTADGMRVTWDGPAGDFRIFRRAADETSFTPVAEVQQMEWIDRGSEFEKTYTYIVQRIVKLGIHQEAESDPSEESTLLLHDSFAPAVPAGLRASPAAGSVELSWERNLEADLGGYRIYRATAGGAFEKIADVSQVPSYSDRAVESGKQYRYRVSAFDKSANESEQSAPATATVP